VSSHLRAVAQPEPEQSVVLALTREEAKTLAAHLLCGAITSFGAADRAEAAGAYSRADECRRDAILMTKVEMKLREETRT
jgi:hypothetical protein